MQSRAAELEQGRARLLVRETGSSGDDGGDGGPPVSKAGDLDTALAGIASAVGMCDERKRRRGVPHADRDFDSMESEGIPPTVATRVHALKRLGNAAFRERRFEDTLQHYSDAIALAPHLHLLYSNRSAAHVALGNIAAAVADAAECVRLRPNWAKGHARLGVALQLLGDDDRAFRAFQFALLRDPDAPAVANYLVPLVLRHVSPFLGVVGARTQPFAPLHCAECCSVLHKPTTLACGHSVCVGCVRVACPTCGTPVDRRAVVGSSVAITAIVGKVRHVGGWSQPALALTRAPASTTPCGAVSVLSPGLRGLAAARARQQRLRAR